MQDCRQENRNVDTNYTYFKMELLLGITNSELVHMDDDRLSKFPSDEDIAIILRKCEKFSPEATHTAVFFIARLCEIELHKRGLPGNASDIEFKFKCLGKRYE
jgi:ribosomal 50S subunit-associated protein YjgA (DUF615 family)